MVVQIRVPHAGTIKVQRVVQQCAVAFGCLAETFEEVREQRNVEPIDLRDLGNFLRIVAVVRQRVVRLGNADFRVGTVAGFTSKLKRDDSSDITLQRENLQVEHQLRVFGIRSGDTNGTIEIRQRLVLCVRFRLLDSPFNFPHAGEVVINFRSATRAEFAFKLRQIFGDGIKQARTFLQGGPAIFRGSTFTEQRFKDDSRMSFGG